MYPETSTMAPKPPPAASRDVVCAHCENRLEISASAMSVNCRHCNQRLIVEDMKIKAYHAVVRLATAGRVEVVKNAQLVAEVRVSELVVNGTVQGNVRTTHRVVVGKKGRIVGDVSSPLLSVAPGGEITGSVRIGAAAALQPRGS